MGSRRPPSAPEGQVIIEEIRSQNRATLEAVEALRESIEERIERLDRESRGRDDLLALAIGELRHEVRQQASDLTELKRLSLRHGTDIAELRALNDRHSAEIGDLRTESGGLRAETRELRLGLHENTLELRGLSHKVEAMNQLHERVAALERKVSERDSPV